MKYPNKSVVFFLLMLFGYGVDTSAYTVSISNRTGGDVRMGLYFTFGQITNKNELVRSYHTHKFSISGHKSRLILTKIKVSIRKEGWIQLPVIIKKFDAKSFKKA